jgi:hypothetical protein
MVHPRRCPPQRAPFVRFPAPVPCLSCWRWLFAAGAAICWLALLALLALLLCCSAALARADAGRRAGPGWRRLKTLLRHDSVIDLDQTPPLPRACLI